MSDPKHDAFVTFVDRVNARPAAKRAAEFDDAPTAQMERAG